MKRKKNSSSRSNAPQSKSYSKNPNIDIYHNFHFSESNMEEKPQLQNKCMDYLRLVELYFFYRFENIPKGKEYAEKKLFSDKVLLENFRLKKELGIFNRVKYSNYKGKVNLESTASLEGYPFIFDKYNVVRSKLVNGEFNNVYHFLEMLYEKLPIHLDLMIHTIPNFFSEFCTLTVDIYKDSKFQW
jgi:hypothetical protein